jgi:hypothetical protein
MPNPRVDADAVSPFHFVLHSIPGPTPDHATTAAPDGTSRLATVPIFLILSAFGAIFIGGRSSGLFLGVSQTADRRPAGDAGE